MKIAFSLETNNVGSRVTTTIDVDDEEWNELSEAEQDAYALEMFLDTALPRLGDWGYQIASR